MKAEAQFAVGLMAQTGQFTTTLVTQVGAAFSQISAEFRSSGLGQLFDNHTQQTPTSPGTSGQESDYGTRHAAGAVGMATSTTQMTIGEAGGEAYAILKDPRQVLMPSAGGRGTTNVFQFSFPNAQVRDDRDIEKLAALLESRFERIVADRASLFGFSSAR